MIDLVIGLIAKSQVNANNLMMPIIMLLALFPTFGEFNETLARMSDYLYTGMVKAYSVGDPTSYRRFNMQSLRLVSSWLPASSSITTRNRFSRTTKFLLNG